MREYDEEYRQLTIRLHRAAERAEAEVERADRLIRKLVGSGLVGEGVVLGPVLGQRPYPPGRGDPASSQAVQAVADLPRGVGVVYWDAEAYLEMLGSPSVLEAEARARFVPFAECELAVKAVFLRHIAAVMDGVRRLPRLDR